MRRLCTRRGDAFNPDTLGKLESLIHIMRSIGSKYNASTAQIATAWAIAKGTVPIIGVTKIAHIEDIIKAAEFELTVEEISGLETAAKETHVEVRGSWEKLMH
ncbi:aldo/keto reductase [Paenibacillus graminis]|nr:aldo/keto reductase [Paenibacillus graminis]MEC0173107.1 aldo/keto reductase [Paenibacillus graminis]